MREKKLLGREGGGGVDPGRRMDPLEKGGGLSGVVGGYWDGTLCWQGAAVGYGCSTGIIF